MSNGVIAGFVKAVKETAFMLDDGQWYGVHPESGIQPPEVRSFAVVQFYTKSVKGPNGWRTYRNVVQFNSSTGRIALKQTSEQFGRLLTSFEIYHEPEQTQSAQDFDDDIPF